MTRAAGDRSLAAILVSGAAVVCLGVGASSILIAQASAGQQPTFRAGVDLVEVDVIVTDRDERHVGDLKKEDFEILEGGKPQQISNFTRIDVPVAPADRSPAGELLEVDVASNEEPFGGRIYVMLMDDLSIGFARVSDAKRVAAEFVRERFGANDLMAVVHTAGRPDVSQDFTSNKRLLIASIEKTRGCKLGAITANNAGDFGREQSNACEPDASRSGQRTLRALRATADSLASVHGRRKAVLLIGEGIYLGVGDADPTGAADEARTETLAALEALGRANASVYGIDPSGIRSGADQDIIVGRVPLDATGVPDPGAYNRLVALNELRSAQDALRWLSGETGGFALTNMNDYGAGLGRVVADNSAYYVLAFQPAGDKRDGKFRDITVRVKRPGVNVRARRGYYAPRPAAPAAPPRNVFRNASAEVSEALGGFLPSSGLGVRLAAAAFKSGTEASVLITAEMLGRDLRTTDSGHIELAYVVTDPEGAVRAGATDRIATRFAPAMREQIAGNGMRLLQRIKLPHGRFQVRLAARNSEGGAVGSVIGDIEIPDYDKLPFSMSHVLIASAAGSRVPTLRPDEASRSVLPTSPTARRSFPQNDTLALFAEIYDDGRTVHKVDIATAIASDSGTVVFNSEDQRDSQELQGRKGGYGYTARLALSSIPPGAYVLSVTARSRLANTPPVSRRIRIHVTPPAAVPQ